MVACHWILGRGRGVLMVLERAGLARLECECAEVVCVGGGGVGGGGRKGTAL